MRRDMTHIAGCLMAFLLAAAPLAAAARQPAASVAKPLPPLTWPRETSRLLDGPGVDRAQRYCLTCHSADYVITQPRGMPEAFWAAEVAKMRTAYGAALPDDQVQAVVKYLTDTYATAPTRTP